MEKKILFTGLFVRFNKNVFSSLSHAYPLPLPTTAI